MGETTSEYDIHTDDIATILRLDAKDHARFFPSDKSYQIMHTRAAAALDAKDARIAELEALNVEQTKRFLAMLDQRTALEAVVESCRWPFTADGVRILPGMTLWYAGSDTDSEVVSTTVDWIGMRKDDRQSMPCVFDSDDELNESAWYSTREAAQAAAGGGEGAG